MNEFGMDPLMLEPDESIRFLQERQAAGEVFRVHDLGYALGQPTYGNNILAIHGIEQVGGHHGNEMRHYDRLIGKLEHAPNAVRVLRRPGGGQTEDLSLLQRTTAEYMVAPARIELPMLGE